MKIVMFVLLAAIALYLVSGAYVFFAACVRRKELPWLQEDKIVKTPFGRFYPQMVDADRWLRSHEVQNISITSRDGLKLHALWIPAADAKGTIILAHGYRSTYLADFSAALDLYHNMGLNMLVISQRSHGKSEGKYITFGVKESGDVLQWVEYHNRYFGSCSVILSGISMGASTVLYTADQALPPNVKGIIADCGFTSAEAILSSVFTAVTHLPAKPAIFAANLFAMLFAGFSFYSKDTRSVLAASRLPVLMIHGKDDDFVPCYMTEEGYKACISEKELLLVDGADHGVSFLVDPQRYQNAVEGFLNKVL